MSYATFHRWTKLPIPRGTACLTVFDHKHNMLIKKAKSIDKHNCFAAEHITEHEVAICGVDSPVMITLVVNASTIRKERGCENESN